MTVCVYTNHICNNYDTYALAHKAGNSLFQLTALVLLSLFNDHYAYTVWRTFEYAFTKLINIVIYKLV